MDVGLPDGSGLALIETLADATPRIDVILGISGDTVAEADVRAAGADGFIPKPIDNLSAFQHAILSHLPAERQPPGPRLLHDEVIRPDSVDALDRAWRYLITLKSHGANLKPGVAALS